MKPISYQIEKYVRNSWKYEEAYRVVLKYKYVPFGVKLSLERRHGFWAQFVSTSFNYWICSDYRLERVMKDVSKWFENEPEQISERNKHRTNHIKF